MATKDNFCFNSSNLFLFVLINVFKVIILSSLSIIGSACWLVQFNTRFYKQLFIISAFMRIAINAEDKNKKAGKGL